MDDAQKELDALTDQPVTVSLGGKSYQLRRATLYDVGVMNRKRKELTDKGDTGNLDVDLILHILCELMKKYQPDMTPEKLALSIPVENINDIKDALAQAGFKLPQAQQETEKVAGA